MNGKTNNNNNVERKNNKPRKDYSWEEDKSNAFINPYNFVGLVGECQRHDLERAQHIERQPTFTGFIDCSLKAKTPVFIPNTSTNHAFFQEASTVLEDGQDPDKCNSYDFFSYTDLSNLNKLSSAQPSIPVIPGSELRGVVRSVFETVTDSCLSTIDNKTAIDSEVTIDTRTVLHKRTVVAGQPGILKLEQNGQWKLYEAEKIMLKIEKGNKDNSFKDDLGRTVAKMDEYQEGKEVWIKINSYYGGREYMPKTVENIRKYIEGKKEEGFVIGYIHKGEPFIRKHHESVFIEKVERSDPRLPVTINDETFKRLKMVIKLYNQNQDDEETVEKRHEESEDDTLGDNNLDKVNVYTEFAAALERHETDLLLVYYAFHNRVCYLSPSCISKEVFQRTVFDILKSRGKYQPCSSMNSICSACALFGFVSDGGVALGSRVRFTDALVVHPLHNPADYYLGLKVLPELSTPKLSATEFYLERPELKNGKKLHKNVIDEQDKIHLWNYDYACQWYKDEKDKKKKKKLAYQVNYQPTIRGRKYYWHYKNDKLIQGKLASFKGMLNKRNCLIRPLKVDENIFFGFRVHFENLTDDELKKLVWSLNLGDNKNEHCHKIGRAKPYGLGSVKISVDSVKIRQLSILDGNINYELKDYNLTGLKQCINSETVKELLIITDFSKRPEDQKVRYPLAYNEDTANKKQKGSKEKASVVYQWFIGNRQFKPGTPNNPIIKFDLPELGNNYGQLYKLIYKDMSTVQKDVGITTQNELKSIDPRLLKLREWYEKK